MFAYRQSPDILKNEIGSLKLDDEAHEVINEGVARIVEGTLADHAKALAGRTSKQNVHFLIADARIVAYELPIDIGDTATDGGAGGEVEFVSSAVDGVILNGGSNVEARLLEAKAQSSRTGEKIDAYGFLSVTARPGRI